MNGQPINVSQCKDVGMSLLVCHVALMDPIACLLLKVSPACKHCSSDTAWTVEGSTLGPEMLALVQVTGFGYDHDDVWAANVEIFKHFTDASRGVRRLGAAAVDLCHTALGMQLTLLSAPSQYFPIAAAGQSLLQRSPIMGCQSLICFGTSQRDFRHLGDDREYYDTK